MKDKRTRNESLRRWTCDNSGFIVFSLLGFGDWTVLINTYKHMHMIHANDLRERD